MEDLKPSDDVPRVQLPVERGWREAVRARMKELDINQVQLATHIHCGQGAISQTLSRSKGPKTSKFVYPISVAMQVQMPFAARLLLAGTIARKRNPEMAADMLRMFERIADLGD